ncbi:unnamed protein product [Rotaria sordida]|uniref:Uncharacterized protein n=1 Tax=Rotaria sordida TaxID=392033 RepID=A0A813WGN5_9BILA|nr:unnamed protein product [Rotaria sordida]
MMIKNEQLRSTNHLKRAVPITSTVSLTSQPHLFQTTSIVIPQRSTDIHAIDISSIKGRFAWEKIALGDTYMPVIFRGTTKYFCVKMLRKLLADYPEDIIRRSAYYQYRKPIALYVATSNELELLNRINSQHSHWTYSRQPFTVADELVRVSDFLPFYEYLRISFKPTSIPSTTSTGSFRPILPQTTKQSLDFDFNMPNTLHEHLTTSLATTSTQIQSYVASESHRENIPSTPRPIAPAPPILRPPPPPSKYDMQILALSRQVSQQSSTQQKSQLPPPSIQQPKATSSNTIINSTNTVLPNKSLTTPVVTSVSEPSTSTTPILANSSSSPDPIVSSPIVTTSRTLSTTLTEKQLTLIPKQSSSSSSAAAAAVASSSSPVPKSSQLNSGWLQINKLYTPYVSSSTSDHHSYKIPISLLTFYDLLKNPSSENHTNESKDLSFSFEQTLGTPQEIELINELCLKQNIKPFSYDTKLIDLLTFYQYCSTNVLFIKELPLNDPKVSICKNWSSIVQINGGICRLRNITTLHEQTVPFIGNNLLKNFIISSQCLSSASLTTPTAAENEFLQLILFFSNMSINLHNAKLIDIESARKEYTVDLILLFNDKFPLNVLNYQHQTKIPSSSQGQTVQSDSSAATNTFAESTPPPSPTSPSTNNNSVASTSQLPLASSSSNRYQKVITFHGHSMIAYICSGIDSNAHRECISIKALCSMLYPNSSIIDKLETRMLRLLRLKKINRFRPQNQQTISFTRLVDIQDIEKHWDYIEKGMHSLSNNDEEKKIVLENTSSSSDKDLKASIANKIENKRKIFVQETSIEVNRSEKRSLRSEMEDIPIVEQICKRGRLSADDNDNTNNNNNNNNNNNIEQSKSIPTNSTQTIECNHSNNNNNNNNNNHETKEDKNVDNDKNQVKTRQNTLPISPIKIVNQQNDKDNKKKRIQQPNGRLSTESSMSSRKLIMPIKKKIKIIRKRRTPRTRSRAQTIAGWLQKYNIEEFCIRLDFYNPNIETAKN